MKRLGLFFFAIAVSTACAAPEFRGDFEFAGVSLKTTVFPHISMGWGCIREENDRGAKVTCVRLRDECPVSPRFSRVPNDEELTLCEEGRVNGPSHTIRDQEIVVAMDKKYGLSEVTVASNYQTYVSTNHAKDKLTVKHLKSDRKSLSNLRIEVSIESSGYQRELDRMKADNAARQQKLKDDYLDKL